MEENYDKNLAVLSIYSGVGGKDAEDWVGILKRMYEKFFKRLNWKYFIVDEDPNEHNGYKFVSFQVQNNNAYKFLKTEKGVHRLVRISPFSAKKLRHTSFAYVEVLPLIEKPNFTINENDIKVEFFRSSGPGGQNVNKLETAVRVYYKPLNITVTCQSERFQHRNKELALKILYSKIQNVLDENHKKTIEELKGKRIEIGWGNQVRSYIFDPYQLVKDLKTGKETRKLQDVLDGKLELIHPSAEELKSFMIK
jgi:peptide chain release factor 2